CLRDRVVQRAAAAWAALAIRGVHAAQPATMPPLAAADRLQILDPLRLRVEDHAVVRRPQCPACGDRALFTRRASAPIVLAEAPVRDGRTLSATATFERHAHLVDPLTGALSSLGPVAGTDNLVWAASLFTHPSSDAPSFDDFHATSMGKGATPDQA